jgi:hypothetical protein
MRIGFHLLAVVLIGSLSTGASLAEDTVGHAADSAAPTPPAQTAGAPAADNAPADQAPKPDDRGPAKSADAPDGGDHVPRPAHDTAAKDDVSTERMKSLGPIDARIAPPSHRFGRSPFGREAKSKVNLHSAITAHPRPTDRRAPTIQPTRNALGLTVPPPNTNAGHDALATALHPAGSAPSVTTTISVPGGSSKIESSVAHPVVAHQNLSPMVTTPVANSGAVNGTGFARHGVAPAVVTGQPKVVAGISGSMIHPKH